MLAALVVAACGKEKEPEATEPVEQPKGAVPETRDTGGRGPFVVGGGGKRVPEGFETSFTGSAGPVKIAYTQLTGADLGDGWGPILLLEAEPGELEKGNRLTDLKQTGVLELVPY